MSWAASLPGAERLPENRFFSKKPLVRGSFAAWGRCFLENIFLKKPLVPGSFAAWGRTFSRKSHFFIRSHLSRAASLPGAKLLTENCFFFEEGTCPGQLRCLGQNFFQKIIFFRSHLPRAASLPRAELLAEFLLFLKMPLVPGSFAAWGRTFLGGMPPPGDRVLSQNHPKSTPEVSSGQPWALSCSSRPD